MESLTLSPAQPEPARNSPLRSRRIPSLDGLRAVAIGMVLLSHSGPTIPSRMRASLFLTSFGNGELGVALFFAISGFLITTLLLRENQDQGQICLRRFYVRRVFRILPAFYTYLLAILALAAAGEIALRINDWFSAGLFVWNYNFRANNWFLGHAWSLSIEEQFYLLWPLALVLLKPRRAAMLAGLLIMAAPVLRVLTYFLFPAARSHVPIMMHTRVDALMFGCLAALWYEDESFQRWMRRLYQMGAPLLAVLFLLTVSPFLADRFEGKYLLPVGYSLESAALTLILLWAMDHADRPVGRLLNLRPVAFIGTISYSLYLWQQLFLTPKNTTLSGWFPLNLLAAFLAAVGSYYLIEQPFLRLRRRWTERPAAAPPEAVLSTTTA